MKRQRCVNGPTGPTFGFARFTSGTTVMMARIAESLPFSTDIRVDRWTEYRKQTRTLFRQLKTVDIFLAYRFCRRVQRRSALTGNVGVFGTLGVLGALSFLVFSCLYFRVSLVYVDTMTC